jgi:hypothetical protein
MPQEKPLIDTRVNITPGARCIHAEAFGRPLPQMPNNPNEPALHQEAYEMLAVMCSMIIERALERRASFPPYGLIKPARPGAAISVSARELDHLGTLEEAMDDTLREAYHGLVDELTLNAACGDSDKLTTFYRRYTHVLATAQAHDGSTLDIQLGLHTATNEINSVLMNIIQGYRDKFPRRSLMIDEFLSIARNSWPLIAQFASMHLQRFSWSPTTEDFFTELHPAPQGGYRLQCTEQGAAYMSKEFSGRYSNRPAYGCPALVNFGSGSAVKKLWDWHLEIIQLMHTQNYPRKSVLALLGPDQ